MPLVPLAILSTMLINIAISQRSIIIYGIIACLCMCTNMYIYILKWNATRDEYIAGSLDIEIMKSYSCKVI